LIFYEERYKCMCVYVHHKRKKKKEDDDDDDEKPKEEKVIFDYKKKEEERCEGLSIDVVIFNFNYRVDESERISIGWYVLFDE